MIFILAGYFMVIIEKAVVRREKESKEADENQRHVNADKLCGTYLSPKYIYGPWAVGVVGTGGVWVFVFCGFGRGEEES